MPEQPTDTRFPGQPFPVGSVVTFVDRDRRTVFGTVTGCGAPPTRWCFRFETATSRACISRHDTRTIALSVSFVLRAPWDDIRDTLLHGSHTRSSGPATDNDAEWQTVARRIRRTAKRCSTVTHSLKRWMGKLPRCRDRCFRQRLRRKYADARSVPRCRSRIPRKINAHGEGR